MKVQLGEQLKRPIDEIDGFNDKFDEWRVV